MVSFGIMGGYGPHAAKQVASARRLLKADRERERIARLTHNDAADLMARVIMTRTLQTGNVERDDFARAGVPEDFIDAELSRAFARARRREPLLDQMVLS